MCKEVALEEYGVPMVFGKKVKIIKIQGIFFIEISKELPEASTHTINNFKKQKMRIRLNQNQMNYLYDNFIKGNTCLMLKLRIDKKRMSI